MEKIRTTHFPVARSRDQSSGIRNPGAQNSIHQQIAMLYLLRNIEKRFACGDYTSLSGTRVQRFYPNQSRSFGA